LGAGGLLLQACNFGLRRVARLDSRFQLSTSRSHLRPRLYQFLEQVGANPVEAGNLVFG
jgi:hypothetical protein